MVGKKKQNFAQQLKEDLMKMCFLIESYCTESRKAVFVPNILMIFDDILHDLSSVASMREEGEGEPRERYKGRG